MKFSCACTTGLALVFAVACSGAAALDAPHTLHHSRAAQPHLSETHHAAAHHTAAHAPSTHAAAGSRTVHSTASRATLQRTAVHGARRHHYYERFTASSFATSAEFAGDLTAGEDPIVRQAAIDALGDMNGTAVVIDPSNGRILAMVNQKLALSPGAEPCSTIKLTVAMAALSEGLVTRDTPVQLAGFRMNMTQALA